MESFDHSILISEVNDMDGHDFASIWENFNKKKPLKFHLEFNFNNLQEKKYRKVLG